MISQLSGACIRAVLVVMMVLMPSLLLPETNPQISDAMVLLALFAALFVIVEYGSTYPGLVEFRAAPPFNRVRFGMLVVTLLVIAITLRGQSDATTLSRLFSAVGMLLGESMDFPLSPIRLIVWLMPEGTTLSEAYLIRAAAGLAYLVSLVALTVFAILIRVRSWPSPTGSFNVWVNLPTFDPTTGADVVIRLKRDGAVNILLGVLLPYVSPPIAVFVAQTYGISMIGSDLMTVWVIAIWAFLPASLFLRGIAMRRLALMISKKRRRVDEAEAAAADPAFLPA
ncbi:hypothetical protein [Jannaschia ovalis]|uniref:Uncharacterized protein n=1 Tax=Jannaschia ovalis TaxID=3038773 RepID=A0ABY8LG22_9RHOB|nr:hypothetical protein [Jannaschia sp. GRR-S6-38]WGH80226.1 hypothetical protein P8627_08165 [Jannaschia sp. GRR-S6-38]